ncbi:MAG: hypothetical protein WAT74_17325 [Flavobacteriales bacterium]
METPEIVRHSPERRHVVEYLFRGEIRFGPAYFSIRLDGRSVADIVVGEEGHWLSDSLYAAQEWLTTEERLGPNTRLLLIDASKGVVSKFKVVEGGFVGSFELLASVVRYRKRWHSGRGVSVTEAAVNIGDIRNWTPIEFWE